MELFYKILYYLQTEMNTPKSFGVFHIICLLITFLCILFFYLKGNYNERKLKYILGTYGIITLILELLKQLIWSFNYDFTTKVLSFDYNWYAFPFQLCTTPMYVSIICLFLKKNKIRNSLLSYITYITILGSISTMIMPDSCFTSDILVNIHTMYLHLGSFVLSIYLLISNEVKVDIKSLLNALKIFIIFVFLANTMNIIVYNLNILNGETFNMFYISPYFISDLPVFNIIQENVPYVLYLTIYVWTIILGSLLIFSIASLIKVIKINKGKYL